MVGCLYEKDRQGNVTQVEVFDTVLKPLVHSLEPARFAF